MMMQQQNEFRRANELHAAILALTAIHGGGLNLQQEIIKLGVYDSHGKGGKYRPNGSRRKVYAKMCRQNHKFSKPTTPAPRVLTPIPRRMWHVVRKVTDYSYGEFSTLHEALKMIKGARMHDGRKPNTTGLRAVLL